MNIIDKVRVLKLKYDDRDDARYIGAFAVICAQTYSGIELYFISIYRGNNTASFIIIIK